MTVVQANEAVIRRFYEELWNEHLPVVAEQIIADTISFRGSLGRTLTGRDEFKRYVEMVLTAFRTGITRSTIFSQPTTGLRPA